MGGSELALPRAHLKDVHTESQRKQEVVTAHGSAILFPVIL